jgi:NDP-sugar pyrophosphorylase family protein
MPPIAILAGGLATRLRPLTTSIPKSMVEVAGAPFIQHQLRLLVREGFNDIVI